MRLLHAYWVCRKDERLRHRLAHFRLPLVRPEQYRIVCTTRQRKEEEQASAEEGSKEVAGPPRKKRKEEESSVALLNHIIVQLQVDFGERRLHPLPEEGDQPDNKDDWPRVEPWHRAKIEDMWNMLSDDGYALGCINNHEPIEVKLSNGQVPWTGLFSSDPEISKAVEAKRREYIIEKAPELLLLVKEWTGAEEAGGPIECWSGAHALPINPGAGLDRDEVFGVVTRRKIFLFWAYYYRFYG